MRHNQTIVGEAGGSRAGRVIWIEGSAVSLLDLASLRSNTTSKESTMDITATGWKNKRGTAAHSCECGAWRQHWVNKSGMNWPAECSVLGCSGAPTLGAHVIKANVTGERIVPMCGSCNGVDRSFDLKGGITLVSATCGS